MLRGTMLLQLCAPLVVAAALIVAVTADCDASSDNQMTRICALEVRFFELCVILQKTCVLSEYDRLGARSNRV